MASRPTATAPMATAPGRSQRGGPVRPRLRLRLRWPKRKGRPPPKPLRPSPRRPVRRARPDRPSSWSHPSSPMGPSRAHRTRTAKGPPPTSRRTGADPIKGRIRTTATTRTTIRTTTTTRTTTRATGETSATAAAAAAVVVSAAPEGSCRAAEGRNSRIRARWSKSKGCSTCATRATVSSAAVATCRPPRTSTSPSARPGASPYVRATTSKERAARRRTTRSTRRCSVSTRCPGWTPKKRATAPASRI